MRKLDSFLNRCSTVFNYIGITCLAIMVVIVFINAVVRYVFKSSFAEGEELARYLFIWSCFLGAAVAYQRKEHISVVLFSQLLPKWLRAVFAVIARLLTTAAVCFFLYSSTLYCIQATQTKTSSMMINFGYFVVISMPIMASYMLLCDIHDVIRWLSRKTTGSDEERS